MSYLSIDELQLKNQRVLMRVDFNVPLTEAREQKEVKDETRIRETLPTIEKILREGGRAILMSHLGRPKGKKIAEMSLAPVAKRLEELLRRPVKFVDDCIGPHVEEVVSALGPSDCLLLENLRFYAEEENNDIAFAEKLSRLGDIYVNDAFGTAHRSHASTVGVTQFFQQCALGYLMAKEIESLKLIRSNPPRPFVVLLGGAKISSKIDVIRNLLDKSDAVLIGGAMAFTFCRAIGLETGRSVVETDKIDLARTILQDAQRQNTRLVLPTDFVVAQEDKTKDETETKIVDGDRIPKGWIGVDIGPRTIQLFGCEIDRAKAVFWNGPMGKAENGFSDGSVGIATKMSGATISHGALTAIGGGDTVATIDDTIRSKIEMNVTHISTGGGASLEFVAGKTLPGIAAISRNQIQN